MFKERTVFILGAGASWHYGYPTGEELIEEIIIKAEQLWRLYKNTLIDKPYGQSYVSIRYGDILQSDYVLKLANDRSPEDAYDLFFRQCSELSKRLRHVNPLVIDYFLGQNEDLQDIAKIIIAWVLLERERETGDRSVEGGNNNHNHLRILRSDPRWSQRDRGNIDIKKYKDDWYRFLIYKLASGCRNPSDINENSVTFVTFNYDLSLEAQLYSAISAIDFFRNDKKSIEKFFSQERFLHIYGQLKDNYKKFEPLQKLGSESNQNAQGYAQLLNKCYRASANINTIDPHEKPKNINVINLAQKKISEAEKVYILGYGFDENNNDLLKLKQSLKGITNTKEVYFTNYNNLELVNKKASEIFSGNRNFFHRNSASVLTSGGSAYERSIHNVYDALERDLDL